MVWASVSVAQYNPHHAHQQCSRLSPMPCCPNGFPIPGRVRCPLVHCPVGFYCHRHVLNRWGVCCKRVVTINQRPKNTGAKNTGVARPMSRTMSATCSEQSSLPCCMNGLPVLGVDCTVQRCPNGHTCFTNMDGNWAVCCPMSQPQTSRTVVMVPSPVGVDPVNTCSLDSPTPCCTSGSLVPGSDCRFRPCPAGSTCNVHTRDAWAVCCSTASRPVQSRPPTCSRMNDVACCDSGSPLQGIQCRLQACPPGYTCNIGNRWAVCCPNSNSVAMTQTCSNTDASACCPRGEMVPGTECRTRPCLNNQYCFSHTQGLWAVCCQEPNNGPVTGMQIRVPSCTASSPTPCCSQGIPLNRAQCKTRGCPAGYICNESTVTGWTACCPIETPQISAPALMTGTNACSPQSPRPCCRRGNPLQPCQTQQNCPSGFQCDHHITRAWSVCCAQDVAPDPAVGTSSANGATCRPENAQPCCTIGNPIPGIDCRAQSCPFGYQCRINTMRLWAVCCTQLGS